MANRKTRKVSDTARLDGADDAFIIRGDTPKDLHEAITLFFDRCLRREQCKIKDQHPDACDRCYHARPAGEYVQMLYSLHLLIMAGFPMTADTLPLVVWRDLGVFRQAMAARMRSVF